MATVISCPFGDWKPPAIGGAVWNGISHSPKFALGLCNYTEGAGRSSTGVNAATNRGTHLAMVSDVIAGATPARYVDLFPIGNSALSALTFYTNVPGYLNTAFKVAAGTVNKGPVAMATMQGYVGFEDGTPRNFAPGGTVPGSAVVVGVGASAVMTYQYRNDDPAGANTFTAFSQSTATVTYLRASPAVNDAFYFGRATPFSTVALFITTPGAGTWTITWEYWNGSAWTALTVISDGINHYRTGGGIISSVDMIAQQPIDMATTTVNSQSAYWIRGRVSAFTSITTVPSSTQYASRNLAKRVLTSDVGRLAASDERINDAVYFGAGATFTELWVKILTPGVYSNTGAWQFWDGSAWTAFTSTDDTVGMTAAAGWYKVRWSAAHVGWTARSLHDGTSRYYVRFAFTTTPGVTTAYIVHATDSKPVGTTDTTEYVPACIHVSEDPATNTPAVISWGIPLPTDIPANAAGLATFWHSTRRIKSRRFALSTFNNSYFTPANGASADSVAIWSDTTPAATLLGTIALGVFAPLTPGTANTAITCGNDAGPPIPLDETLTGSDRINQAGTYKWCFVHRKRVWHWGANAMKVTASGARESFDHIAAWSEENQFHHYMATSKLSIGSTDGDDSMGGISFAGKAVLFKRHHVYIATGEPNLLGTGLQVETLSDTLGCIAPHTITIVGTHLYWLSAQGLVRWDGSSAIEVVPASLRVRDLIRYCLSNAAATIHGSCAAYDPVRETLLLAMPGIQQQIRGGASPGVTSSGAPAMNDGALALHVPSSQWAIYAGFYPSRMITALWSDNQPTVVMADYYGRLYRLTTQTAEGRIGGGFTYSGTLTAPFSTTLLTAAAATFPDGSTDFRFHGLFVEVRSSAGVLLGVRPILLTSPTTATVQALTTLPTTGATFRIGDLYGHADTGDWQLGEPGRDKAVDMVQPHLDSALVSPNAVDVAVDATDAAETGSEFVYATGTLGTGVNPAPICLTAIRGFVQCLRIGFRLSRAARPRILGLAARVRLFVRRSLL